MNDNVVRMATGMLRSLNLPAKLIQRPQGDCFDNPISKMCYFLVTFNSLCFKFSPSTVLIWHYWLLQHNFPSKSWSKWWSPAVHCELESVELEGFGAFLAPAKYPLAQRGVRIVSGKNLDSVGADSNGAGKTTLVMAPLWALTGTLDQNCPLYFLGYSSQHFLLKFSIRCTQNRHCLWYHNLFGETVVSGTTDPRPDSVRGLPSTEVVHNAAKRARVRVDGTINGKPFTVERATGRWEIHTICQSSTSTFFACWNTMLNL